jgi:hypothetical protein
MDLPNPNLVARPSGQLAELLERAMRTPIRADVPFLCIPMGPSDVLYHPNARPTPGSDTVVRLGVPETALDMSAEPKVLAASRAVADALVAKGMKQKRVYVMPSPLARQTLGGGGAGLLTILPTHDRTLTTRLLAGLRRLDRTYPLRLLPTAFDRRLGAALNDQLPHAELLERCSDEQRFAQLASDSDVVLGADLSDPFERHALIAASVGTPALSLNPRGPVFDVLGTDPISTPETLAEGVAVALESARSRVQMSEIVLAACGAESLRQLLGEPQPTAG